MDSQSHIVTGIYASRAEAETVRSRLIERGLPPRQVKVVERARADDNPPPIADDDSVLKEMLIDGTVGTVVGGGLGALAQIALVAANVTLFAASPLLAPLAMIGWGAGLGALVGGAAGANTGAKQHHGTFADLLHFAIRSGHVTLIAEARTPEEQATASEVIGTSIAGQEEHRGAPGSSSDSSPSSSPDSLPRSPSNAMPGAAPGPPSGAEPPGEK